MDFRVCSSMADKVEKYLEGIWILMSAERLGQFFFFLFLSVRANFCCFNSTYFGYFMNHFCETKYFRQNSGHVFVSHYQYPAGLCPA